MWIDVEILADIQVYVEFIQPQNQDGSIWSIKSCQRKHKPSTWPTLMPSIQPAAVMKDARQKEPKMVMALVKFMELKTCVFSRTALTLPKGRAFVLDMAIQSQDASTMDALIRQWKIEFTSAVVANVLAQYNIVTDLLNRRVYANTTTDACYASIRLNWGQQSNQYCPCLVLKY